MSDKTIICPNCRQAPAQPKPLFPFCSERCKTADLGAWAAEKYRVPVVDPEEAFTLPEESRLSITADEDVAADTAEE